MPHVDPQYAKTGAYGRVIQEILEAGVCPFCPKHFTWHPNPVIARDEDWFITESMQPYEHAKRHYLIICSRHIEAIDELEPEDMASVLRLVKVVAGNGGGGLLLRFGETRLTGATVAHLHFHVVQPEEDPESGRAMPVWFPIG